MREKVFNLQIVFACAFAAAPCAAASTQTVKNSSLFLNIEKNRYDSSVGLKWKWRWDFKDIYTLNFSFSDGAGNWDLTENTRLELYGVSINPWKMILKKREIPGAASGPGSEGYGASAATKRHKKIFSFSLMPVYRDLKEEMPERIKELIIENSLKDLPGWEEASEEGKKAFIKDVLSMDGVWKLHVMEKPKEGLEYLSE